MLGLLSLFGGGIPWKLIGAGMLALAVAGGMLWFRHVLAERDDLLVAATNLAKVARENADVVTAERAQHAKSLAAVNAVNEIATVRQERIVTIKEKIAHAPPAECPMPAALADALDWLRQQPTGAGAAAGAGGGPGGAAEGPGGPGGAPGQP